MASPKHNWGSRSSQIIRELNMRIPKCWKVIDGIFANSDEETKKEIAKFLLGKYIPDKLESTTEIIQRPVQPEEFRSRLSEIMKYADN